jgi:hypothetical protein
MTKYFNSTFTHNYIIGVDRNGQIDIYFIELDLEGLRLMFNSLTTTRGHKVYRYNSTKYKLEYLKQHATKHYILCDSETFTASRRTRINKKGKAYIENRGECFEYLVSEKFKVNQNALPNLSHKNGGDVIIDGIPYQVKFERSGIVVD